MSLGRHHLQELAATAKGRKPKFGPQGFTAPVMQGLIAPVVEHSPAKWGTDPPAAEKKHLQSFGKTGGQSGPSSHCAPVLFQMPVWLCAKHGD